MMAGMEKASERITALEAHPPCSEQCEKFKRLALIAACIWRETERLFGIQMPSLNADTEALIKHAKDFDETAWKQFMNLPGHEPSQQPARKATFQTGITR